MSRTAKEQEAYDQGALDALDALRSQMKLKRDNARKALYKDADPLEEETDRFKGYDYAVQDVEHMVGETRLSILVNQRKRARNG